jgi:hypothetical protein
MALLAAANTQSPAQTFHDWSRLPTELQLEVLSHLLIMHDSIGQSTNSRLFPQSLLPLVKTRNQHLASLSQEVWYRENVFRVIIQPNQRNWKRSAHIVRPNSARAHTIRRLQIWSLDKCSYPETMKGLYADRQGWRFLLVPKEEATSTVHTRQDIAWQASYTNLQELSFDYIDNGAYGSINKVMLLKDLVSKTKTELKANGVHMEMWLRGITERWRTTEADLVQILEKTMPKEKQ